MVKAYKQCDRIQKIKNNKKNVARSLCCILFASALSGCTYKLNNQTASSGVNMARVIHIATSEEQASTALPEQHLSDISIEALNREVKAYNSARCLSSTNADTSKLYTHRWGTNRRNDFSFGFDDSSYSPNRSGNAAPMRVGFRYSFKLQDFKPARNGC